MLIVGVLCLCAAFLSAATGLRSLARPRSADPHQQALRALAPTQFAAAVMLAAAGAVALAGDARTGLPLMIVCVLGAVGTVAAGSWQGARHVARQAAGPTATGECAGSCAACTLSCR
jgi:hypothetical protein